MKCVIQFLIIVGFSYLGELLNLLIPLPIPSSIYGIALLFMALELKVIRTADIREVSNFLLATMPIMFLPAAVGVLDAWDKVQSHLLEYSLVVVVSTFVVMGISGWVTQKEIRRKQS